MSRTGTESEEIELVIDIVWDVKRTLKASTAERITWINDCFLETVSVTYDTNMKIT